MAIKTNTAWNAEDWNERGHNSATLERDSNDDSVALLEINYHAQVRLKVADLRDLSRAAALIADELEATA